MRLALHARAEETAGQPGTKRPSVLAKLVRGNVWGLLDQAVLSASTFATTILLARVLGPSPFGEFVLAYTALLVLNAVQTALITQPHNVLAATKEESEYVAYTSSAASAQLLFAAVVASGSILAGAIAAAVGWDPFSLLLALAPAVIGTQLLEFARRVLYTEERLREAFSIDVLGYVGQAMLLVLLWRLEMLTGPAALLSLGAATTLAAVAGALKIRSGLEFPPRRGLPRGSWQFGKWLLGARASFWISSYSYLYVAAAILGTGASGVLKAAQTILAPLNVPLLFLDTVLPIRFARVFQHGGIAALTPALARAASVTVVPVAAYCLLASLFAQPILRVVYGEAYEDYGSVVVLFAVYYFLSYVSQLFIAGLNARRRTNAVFVAHVVGATSIVGGWALVDALGVEGAVAGMTIGIAGTLLLLALFYWRREAAAPVGAGGS
ncbi:MAG: hypothetical protein M3292_06215 [Actinomycetota bacterium]|nr:hypothetical protein [Actinomycetota bacterium]